VLAPGFFEYELTPQGDLLITLLRAVGELSRPDLRTRPGHAGWPTQTPLAQCLGASRIELAIAPIGGADAETPSHLERLWEDAFVGLSPRWVRDRHSAGLPGESWIELEGEGPVFSALKPAEDGKGVVLRCYNSLDLPVDGRWRLGRPVARAERVRADETSLGPLQLTGDRRSIDFSAGPRGMVSTRIEFEG
jgi:alpha-mannosidase